MQINNAQLNAIISHLQARHAAPEAASLPQVMRSWEILSHKFCTLIGLNGVNLILGRSLDRVRPQFPWLPAAKDAQFAKLLESYSQQSPAVAIAANSALIEAFITLLATLIGAGLTVQFLRSAFGDDSATPNNLEKKA